ncbi:MAG: TldD/PmbA family protein [candidate division Zixibacteria bacterium]|nr:TldD/PmbA family protein [candidate division Zixibacteria bacterium]
MSKALEILDKSLNKSSADQTELVCESEEFYLTRFAENKINGNIGRTDHTVWCRAIIGQKIGIAKTNNLSQEAVDNLVKKAVEICSQQHDDPQFSSLVKSSGAPESTGFIKSTADYSAFDRANAIKTIVDIAGKDSLETAGMFQTSQTELAVANSLGTRQQGKVAEARLSITLSDSAGRAGFAQTHTRDVDEIDFKAIADRAVTKAARSVEPLSLEPGPYTVILDPEAVADFLLFLGFLGFGGKGKVSRPNFMAGKMGEKIMGDNITITEDPFHSQMRYIPFDYEGVPRRKVRIIENGIAKGLVYNSYFAALNDTESTGNALAPDNSFGPYPKAMVMNPGTIPLDEIISSTERAIYIAHFWYVNFINPIRTLVTGTTRDGTFLIENGNKVSPVADMRINQSMLEAFNSAEVLSEERRLVYKYGVMMYVPAMKINNFNFVSAE